MPKSDNGDERSHNVYPQFMRATAQDNAGAVQNLIDQARSVGQLDDNLLRLALQNAAKKGNVASARVLLENGAKTDLTGSKGSPALFWAVSQPQTKGHAQLIRMLLHGSYAGCPADTEWRDENGSTIFMSAALRGHKEALAILLEGGAKVNARDRDHRTILHILAADKKVTDKKTFKWDRAIVSLILDQPIDLDLRDNRHRTALHWAAATGKRELVEQLLSRPKHKKPNVNMTTSRGKTAIHLACDANPPDPSIVELLLKHGADPALCSDGGFTCLHNSASVQSSVEIVNMLLDHSPQLINAQTSPGLTALHFAAQAGSLEVVECLLARPDTKINCKDTFYSTPLLRAAQSNYLNVVNRLAPAKNTNRLSSYALAASNAFEATIVDFRYAGEHQNLVQKRSVYEVLYGLDAKGDHVVTTQVENIKSKSRPGHKPSGKADSRPRFRWIHLPSNNMAWVEALIAKSFIESGATDVDGFKAVEKGFSQQHRGSKFHSHFMRPLCQRSPRGTDGGEKLPSYGTVESALRAGASQQDPGRGDIASSPERTGRRRVPMMHPRINGQGPPRYDTFSTVTEQAEVATTEFASPNANGTATMSTTRSNTSVEQGGAPGTPRVSETSPARDNSSPQEAAASSAARRTRGGRRRRRPANEERGQDPASTAGAEAADGAVMPPVSRRTSMPLSELSVRSSGSNAKGQAHSGSNITFFMPYLHFETDERRRRMREAVNNADAQLNSIVQNKRPKSDDETLIWAHLHSTTGLHLRRTLDQFYLHGIDTEDRDADQVVGRYCRDKGKEEKIFMVDQLWLWILGPGLILTSFPQRWQQPKNDPLNVLDGIIEDLNSKTRPQVQTVYDLALLITARCTGSFDRHRPGDEDFQFLDMFESSIGNVNNQETALYKEFYEASATVNAWLRSDRAASKGSAYYGQTRDQYPDVVDRFINIGAETKLLQEIKDIRDELNMISLVLNQQRATLPALCDAVCDAMSDDMTKAQSHARARECKRKIEEQKKIIAVHLDELARMGKLAENIEESLLNLLDLKQKQSNALEARFARDQAAGTVRQGQIIMVFTMVTIIFLPLSFMASFFAINIQEFPHNRQGQTDLHLGYVTRYTLGIGLGISVALIAVAFSLNHLSALGRMARETFAMRRAARARPAPSAARVSSELIELRKASHEGRRSGESSNSIEFEAPRRVYTGFSDASRRQIYSHDLERG